MFLRNHRDWAPLLSSGKNSTCRAPGGALKLKLAAVNFGARFQFRMTTENSGAFATSFDVITSLKFLRQKVEFPLPFKRLA